MIVALLCFLVAAPAFSQNSARDLYLENTRPDASSTALGARIQVRKQQQGGWRVAAPDTVFRSGDKVRVEVESKSAAHVYVVARGSDGTWSVLFPQGDLKSGARVRARQTVSIYAEFDETPGEELLYVVLSRRQLVNREQVLKSVDADSSVSAGGATEGTRDLLLETAAAPEGQAMFAVGKGEQMVTKFLLRHR